MNSNNVSPKQQHLISAWESIYQGAGKALEWIAEVRDSAPKINNEADAFNLKLYRARNLANSLKRVSATPMTVGFFGLSQAGKSYLISALAADNQGQLETDIGNQQRLNFIDHFNPIGSDPKMRTGLHIQHPSHLIGKLVEVSQGREAVFNLTGIDWPTRDGSGIRDYLHVWDLALAHLKAMENFDKAIAEGADDEAEYAVINLGTGNGVTVREFLLAFENVVGKQLPVSIQPPRPGDVAGAYANADKAWRLLGWKAEKTIEEGIADALKWGEVRETIIHY